MSRLWPTRNRRETGIPPWTRGQRRVDSDAHPECALQPPAPQPMAVGRQARWVSVRCGQLKFARSFPGVIMTCLRRTGTSANFSALI
jgi:hypothetical protein